MSSRRRQKDERIVKHFAASSSTSNTLTVTLETETSRHMPSTAVNYNNYPLDIWFLISEHVHPEDIGRFALICRNSAYVVSSATFWFHTYKRFYKPTTRLPVRLQPTCMVQLGGLRACVIRSLFYFYEPFARKLRNTRELSSLLKLKCSVVWYKQIKDYWTLCFKFCQNTVPQESPDELQDDWENSNHSLDMYTNSEVPDNWENSDHNTIIKIPTNIYANSEEGCRILVVITDRFFPPPDYMRTCPYLKKIFQPLSNNLRTYKLEMTFADYSGNKIGSVSYDPVKQCKVLRWWEPEYQSYLS